MKTNIGLVEYCKKQLGKPYWWGTFGQVADETLYQQKKKQYPSQYTANDFPSQYGKNVHDCVGLIKGYRWLDDNGKVIYNLVQDVDVSGMLNMCTKQGTISTMPDVLGTLVFMSGHVGVYIGNGEVIEARGHAYGVVQTKLKDRAWKKWGQPAWLEYVDQQEETMTEEEQMKYIQDKCGFDDNTMFWLSRYLYHTDLFQKWYESYNR